MDTISYKSTTVGIHREALVYLPPSYSSKKSYPVLYLLHGIGGDQYEWVHNGNATAILDNLYASNKLIPMIVVFPNGRAMKNDKAVGDIFSKDKVTAFSVFEDDLLKDLIPYIENNYTVTPKKDYRAIAGLSMGGGQAFNFGFNNLKEFAWIGGFSAAPNTKTPEELLPNPAVAERNLNLIWISCGDKDDLLIYSKRTHTYLEKYEIPHIYYIEPGVHDFKVWKNDLYHFSQLLFK